MKYVDFRSDTVTQPTDSMRAAIAQAVVGDDVYDDDPTVKELEAYAAELTGKEAALFVPSGTFGNQLCVLTHTRRGDEVILGDNSHILMHEVGSSAVIAGVQLRSVPTRNGWMDPKVVERLIREDDIHYPDTGLICVENAHGCGAVVSLENMRKIYRIGQAHNVPIHMDGARLFNAAAVLGVSAAEVCQYADSITFCLSKGLCAPVGSIVVGTQAFIQRAKRNRKLMGGGMRQIGFLAAAGLVALKEMIPNLEEDHKKCKYLTEKLSRLDGLKIKHQRNDINMVFFEVENPKATEDMVIHGLLEQGIKINGTEENEWRFVTNYWTSYEDIDRLVDTFAALIL
ncbi:MAG: aminotransferase class I/II-fold pyridoxal phosphate-dependent enzyme [Clostridia bacterium]|nr:aminotransferase class I/II-fold pyridoxal phosphate-dependent enzyme [Clostridia bacterium]